MKNIKKFTHTVLYRALCLMIISYRITNHAIKLKITGDISHSLEIDHYMGIRVFTRIGGINAP